MQTQFRHIINGGKIANISFEPKGYFGYALEKIEETEYIYRESDEW